MDCHFSGVPAISLETLEEQPESDGLGQCLVRTTSGVRETFHCQVDAVRAAAAAAKLTLEAKALENLKRLWVSQLAAACVGRGIMMAAALPAKVKRTA